MALRKNSSTTRFESDGKSRTPLFLFDFDGTICDSFTIFVEVLNLLAPRYGFRSVKDQQEIESLQQLSMRGIIDHLGITLIQIPFILRSARAEMLKRVPDLRAFPGMIELLQSLPRHGSACGCLTSNSEKLTRLFFEREAIPIAFLEAGTSLFGKAAKLKRVLRRESFSEAYYIGDEIRDIEAARSVGIKSIAVSWGYNHANALQKAQPDYLVNDASDLQSLLLNKINCI